METPERRPDDKDWLKLMLIKHFGDSNTLKEYITEQSNCFTCVKQDSRMAKQSLLQLASSSESENDTPELLDQEHHHSTVQHFTELLDQNGSQQIHVEFHRGEAVGECRQERGVT